MATEPIEQRLGRLALMLALPEETRRHASQAFAAVSDYEIVPEGTALFTEGDSSTEYGCVLMRGTVTVTTDEGFSSDVKAPVLLGEMKQFQFDGAERRAANVVARDELAVLRFRWDELYRAIDERLDTRERAEFQENLQRYAWMHFLELQDEL